MFRDFVKPIGFVHTFGWYIGGWASPWWFSMCVVTRGSLSSVMFSVLMRQIFLADQPLSSNIGHMYSISNYNSLVYIYPVALEQEMRAQAFQRCVLETQIDHGQTGPENPPTFHKRRACGTLHEAPAFGASHTSKPKLRIKPRLLLHSCPQPFPWPSSQLQTLRVRIHSRRIWCALHAGCDNLNSPLTSFSLNYLHLLLINHFPANYFL